MGWARRCGVETDPWRTWSGKRLDSVVLERIRAERRAELQQSMEAEGDDEQNVGADGSTPIITAPDTQADAAKKRSASSHDAGYALSRMSSDTMVSGIADVTELEKTEKRGAEPPFAQM